MLWCGNARSGRSNGWSFPPRVERHLRELTAGKKVLQQFGGMARWGVKIDIDPTTRPHVIADAWLLPFKKNAFDVVIVDPPYHSINQQMKNQLIRAAAYCAREHVIWFHTMWIAGDAQCQLEQSVAGPRRRQLRGALHPGLSHTSHQGAATAVLHTRTGHQIQPLARRADRPAV